MEKTGIKIEQDRATCRAFEKVEWSIYPEAADIRIKEVRYCVYNGHEIIFEGKGFIYKDCFIDEDKRIRPSETVPYWKIRYAPSVQGQLYIDIEVMTSQGSIIRRKSGLLVDGIQRKGFIKVSKDKRYLEFTNGDPYFAIGINAINLQGDFISLASYMKELAANGCNYIRLWLSQSHVPLFSREAPGICQEHAWGYDYIFGIAEEYGIYIKVCFEHMRKFVDVDRVIWSDHESMFSYKKGGPCMSEYDFFAKAEAREKFKQEVVDYIISRWGYSPNIFAWELWNEIDTVRGCGTNFQSPMWKAVVDWNRDIGEYIKQRDHGRHLVVNSLGSYVVRKEIWELEVNDLAQVHGYWKPNTFNQDSAKDIAAFVEEYLEEIKRFDKPALFAEFGLVNDRWGSNDLQYADRDGIIIHDGAWCSLATGAAGTAMFWWGNMLREMGLQWVFKGISSFVKDIDFASEGFQDVYAICNKPEIKVRGQKGKNTTIIWLKNRQYTWWNKIMNSHVPGVTDVSLEVYDHADGIYTIQIWDSVTGEVIKEYMTECRKSTIIVELDRVHRDCPIKIIREHNS